MAKDSKKFVFTLNEIGGHAFKKWPGRWKNQESAYASVKAIAQRLEIGDINGKKKYKLIAAKDAARILEELTKTEKKKAKHGQADLFSLLPAEDHKEKKTLTLKDLYNGHDLAELNEGPVEVLTVQPATSSEEYRKETARQLEEALELLQDAMRVFCKCLIEFERGNR